MKKATLLCLLLPIISSGMVAQGPVVKYFGDKAHNYYPLLLAPQQNGDYMLIQEAGFYDSTITVYLDIPPTGSYIYNRLSPQGDTIWAREEKEEYHHSRPVLVEDGQGLFTLFRGGLQNTSCSGVLAWQSTWTQTQYCQINKDGILSNFKALNPDCVALLEDAVSLPDGNKLMVVNRTDNDAAFYPDKYAQIVVLNHDNTVINASSLPDRRFFNARLAKRDDCSFLMAFHENNLLKVSVLSHNGQIMSTQQYPYAIPDKLVALGNGAFLLLAHTSDKKTFICKTDKDGVVQWNKYFDDVPIVDAGGLEDHSVLLLFNQPGFKFGLYQLDAAGNLAGKRMYSLPDTAATAYFLAIGPDNTGAIAGSTGLYNHPTLDYGPTNSFLLLDTIPWPALPSPPPIATVNLQAFEDANQNCLHDAGEPLLPAWRFQVNNGVGGFQVQSGAGFPAAAATYTVDPVNPAGAWAVCAYPTTISIAGDTVIYYGVRNLCQPIFTNIDTTLCTANYYKINELYCDPGHNEFVLPAASGCDSVVTINLTVLPQLETKIKMEFCYGDSITYNGVTYNNTATVVTHFSIPGYCDSVVTVNLVRKPETYAKTYTICNTPPVVVGNHSYTQPGTYTDTLSSYLGCDSIIVSTLKPKYYNRYLTYYLCPGGSVIVNNQVFTQPAIFQDTISTPYGCDTILITQINYQTKTKYQTVRICKGGSYSIGNSVYTQPGSYTDILTTVAGCDSIVHTILAFYNPVAFFNFKINPGQVITNGVLTFDAPGTYIDTLVSVNGCDSIVTTSIHLNNIVNYQNTTTCQSQTYVVNGQVYTIPAIVCDTFFSCSGLDSVYYLTITKGYYSETQTLYICPGSSVTVGNSTYNAPGTYFDTIPQPNSCPTIWKTIVEWGDKTTNLNVKLCPGQHILIGGTPYSAPGYYNIYLQTWQGCDSLVRLNISNYYSFTKYVYLCPGDVLQIAGHTITAPAVVYDTLSSLLGCDSIIRYNISWNTKTRNLYLKICPGGSVTVAGSVYTAPGTYRDTLTTWLGCDSIVITNLSWNNKSKTNSYQICPGQQITVGPSVYTTAGNFIDTFHTWLGCDSIVYTNIKWRTVTTYLNKEICNGGTVWIAGTAYAAPGVYRDTLTSWQGCDSILAISICHSAYKIESSINENICVGDTLWWGGQAYAEAGIFTDTFPNVFGCDSIVHLHLSVLPTAQSSHEVTLCQGDSLVIGDLVLSQPGVYQNIIQASNGCDSLINIIVQVNPVYADTVDISIASGSEFLGQVIYGDTMLVVNGATTLGCDSITTYRVQALTGTGAPQTQLQARVWPNPNAGLFNVQLATVTHSPLEARVYNSTGEMILRQEITPAQSFFKLDIPNAVSGIYHVQIKDQHGNYWAANVAVLRH